MLKKIGGSDTYFVVYTYLSFVGLIVFEQISAVLFERPLDLYVFTHFWTDTNHTSVRMEHSDPTGWILMEFDICAFFRKSAEKILV
jgi:hypothetical protein